MSEASREARGNGSLLAAMAVLVAAVSVAAPVGVQPSRADQPAGSVVAQPVLGTADGETKLMGAASSGDAGETWAYRQLPLPTGPPVFAGHSLDFASPGDPQSPQPQLAFLRYTDATDWQVAETPVDEQGKPYRGFIPNEASARITPHGGGLLVGRDQSRPVDQQATALVRDPGGRFTALPAPPPDVLLPSSGDVPAETLADDLGSGHVADAAIEEGGKTGAFFAPRGRAVQDAVIHYTAGSWSREPVEVPASSQSDFEIVAIAATDARNAWMVARTDSGDPGGVMLFKRTGDQDPHWVARDLAAPLFQRRADAAAGVSDVVALGGAAEPLTVTPEGVWIDGSLRTSDGESHDFTLFFDPNRDSGRVTSSWCDGRLAGGAQLCDHPFPFQLSALGGYRSFAWPGDGFGSRVLTNPLDVGGDVRTNRGTYLTLAGTSFVRMPGAGGNIHPSGAFSAPDEGWLEGPVHITRSPGPQRLDGGWPLALRAPLTAVAPEPGTTPGDPGAGALAVGLDGAVARYVPGRGWSREFLLTSSGSVARPVLRGVAWPAGGRAYAVGDLGSMWMWRNETGLWEKDPAAPIGAEANFMDVAFSPNDPDVGYAVGRSGTLLRYGKTWTQETLPPGFGSADFTQVAFAGSEAIVAAGSDLLTNDGTGWKVDASAQRLLRSVPGNPRLVAVAGLPDGGVVASGADVVIERDRADGEWRFSDQPLPGSTVIAMAAYRTGGRVAAVVSAVPRLTYPPPDNLPLPNPNEPPPLVPPFPLPGDGYVLRESGGTWRDEQHTAFGGSGIDRPVKSDPILAFDLDADGHGWAVGGWSGEADSAGRGSSGRNQQGRADRQRSQTAGVYRYGGPLAAAPAQEGAAPVSAPPGPVRFAVGGHAQCEQACSDLALQGLLPDRTLTATLAKVAGLSGRRGGPRFFLYTGGRSKPAAAQQGITDAAEAERYASLLGSQPSLPVFPAPSAGDLNDTTEATKAGLAAFSSAFSGFGAPFGHGPAAPGIQAEGLPGAPAGAGARTHYAFDSTGPEGTLRVIVIDNSAGSLDASDAFQNPAEPQKPWLTAALADAKARGIPSVVVGSRDLNSRFIPRLNAASDGSEVAQMLVDGGASAYFFERPEETRSYPIPSGGAQTIPSFGTGTLGYRSPVSDAGRPDQPDALFGDSGFLVAQVELGRRDPATNRVPVSVRMIPMVDDLSLQPIDGTLLRRSRPSLFQGLGRRPLGGDRWGRVSSADGNANPPGGDPYVSFPTPQCLVGGCSTRVAPEYEFSSSDPDIGDFVRQDPQSANLRKPFLASNGKVVTDSRSGLFCPFNAGTTTVRIAAGGLAFAQVVTVLPGSVQRPCGTRPLRPDRFRTASPSAAPPPAPPPSPAGNSPVSFTPPPPPPPPVVPIVPARVLSPPARPADFLARPQPLESLPPVPPPQPPPAVRPSPPGGGLGRAYQVEKKREEEVVPEEMQAFARYRQPDRAPSPAFVLGAIVLASLAGAGGLRGRRRRPRPRPARATVREPIQRNTWKELR